LSYAPALSEPYLSCGTGLQLPEKLANPVFFPKHNHLILTIPEEMSMSRGAGQRRELGAFFWDAREVPTIRARSYWVAAVHLVSPFHLLSFFDQNKPDSLDHRRPFVP
jgi:hypothetical protein